MMTRFKETKKEYYCVVCEHKHQKPKIGIDKHYSFRLPDEILSALGDK